MDGKKNMQPMGNTLLVCFAIVKNANSLFIFDHKCLPQIFNGVRVSDIHSVATLLRERVLDIDQTLAGIGYSMGGIVLNRYVSTETNVALDVSVSISGALCTLHQMKYHRSQKTWQSAITGHMKEMFYNGKWGQRLHQFLGHQGYQRLLRAQTIVVRHLDIVDRFWNGGSVACMHSQV